MQPSGDVDRVQRAPAAHGVGRGDAGPGDGGGGLVHARPDGVVGRAQAVHLVAQCPPDRLDVAQVVHAGEQVGVDLLRPDDGDVRPVQHTELPRERDGDRQPDRPHGMALAGVVLQEGVVPDDVRGPSHLRQSDTLCP
jgi:hypothetical protein